ncbi:hypothetical protein RB213_011184 [Colletotrichum asianum]
MRRAVQVQIDQLSGHDRFNRRPGMGEAKDASGSDVLQSTADEVVKSMRMFRFIGWHTCSQKHTRSIPVPYQDLPGSGLFRGNQ